MTKLDGNRFPRFERYGAESRRVNNWPRREQARQYAPSKMASLDDLKSRVNDEASPQALIATNGTLSALARELIHLNMLISGIANSGGLVVRDFRDHYIFHFFATSIPSASVPTLASMAYPSASRRLHSAYSVFSGVEKTSMNSFSSSSGLRF